MVNHMKTMMNNANAKNITKTVLSGPIIPPFFAFLLFGSFFRGAWTSPDCTRNDTPRRRTVPCGLSPYGTARTGGTACMVATNVARAP